jgi:ZIP family zinc transporter
MSGASTVVLGAVAGLTIFLGLPFARMRRLSLGVRALLNSTAAGILLFLLWDVLSAAVEPVEEALTGAATEHTGSWYTFAGLSSVFAVGLVVGLMSLVYYDRWSQSRARRAPSRSLGPGAMAVDELAHSPRGDVTTEASRIALLIAVGIGLHNFSEGLAIGQSAASGEISLALLLVIGFGLHNATEGFGITAPLAAQAERPSWGYLLLLGLIGGGPTFVGTLLGQATQSDIASLAFLALAAGSILYVLVQLLRVGDRLGRRELLFWGLIVGMFLGFSTDFVIAAAGV